MIEAGELLVAEVDWLIPMCRGRAENACHHLGKSAESALYNTSEGVAAFKPKVKANCYEIAKREAAEVLSILKLLVTRKILVQSDIDKAWNIARSLIAMLVSAIKAQDKR